MNTRLLFAAMTLLCVALLGCGLYLQYIILLNPCPLCLVQRGFFIGLAATALLAALHGRWRRCYAVGTMLLALLGAATAGRQLWLQYSPDGHLLECGAGLGVMLETMPLFDVVARVFEGTGDCAIVQWTFLGLSIPGWSLLSFGLILLTSLYILLVRR